MGVSFDAPESEINVIKIEKLEGDAEVSICSICCLKQQYLREIEGLMDDLCKMVKVL